jgi:hypothetical protein
MKTNLLKIAGGMLFSLAMLSVSNVSAQIKATENFEYTVGTDYQLSTQTSGIGWMAPWSGKDGGVQAVGGGFHQVIAGNLEGDAAGQLGASGAMGGQWVNSYRQLATPAVNIAGTSIWASYTGKNVPTTNMGLVFKSSINASPGQSAENLYIGTLPGDFIGIGNCYQDAACTGPRADAPGIVSTAGTHYYLVHINFLGGNIIHADLWADYNGATIPLADFAEPTYQNGGYRSAADGINILRIGGDTQPVDASTKYSTFDAIRVSSTFFRRGDLKLDGTNFALDVPTPTNAAVKSNSSFYPNPVTGGELNVVADKESLKSVSIIDLSGNKVASQAVNGSSAQINTQGLAKGVYILEVVGSKTTSRNKVVID